MELKYKGKLPEKNGYFDIIKNGKPLEYDYVEWEFLSLGVKSIQLKFNYYKDGEIVHEKKQKYGLITYDKTKTVSIMVRNSRIDVTNLLISISNDLFANCRERSNERCILTKVEN